VQAVDDSVGELLAHLDELGIADNTCVIFYSDNGGLCTKKTVGPGCNLPLRASKGWLYEGGIRVPLIVRLPGKKHAGMMPNEYVTSTDFYPTLLSLAGLPLKPKQHVDGRSFMGILNGAKARRAPRALYWHYPHYHGSTWAPGAAIRDGDWKLIEFYHYGGYELYNLREDPGERNNLAKQYPDRAKGLLHKLHLWQKELGAKMPVAP
jgi:arylsulfatase A-like enzyme